MAVTFRKTNQGFTNMWTQLKDIVSTKSLYNNDDYENLTTGQKEQYLTMLYQNNDALAQRLPEEYNSEYGDTESRFALLSATNAKYQFNLNWNDPEYQRAINEQIDKQLDAQLSSDVDKDKTWVDWMVENKYDGSYAKFVADYSGENAKTFQDALVEMVPEEYELTEETFTKGVSEVSEARGKLYDEVKTSQSDAYNNTLNYVREKLRATAEKEAYNNASALTKIFNTAWQIPTLWAAETIEIVEGIGDAVIGAVAGLESIFTMGFGDTEWAETAIKYDWWAPETWLNVAGSASYLSRYSGDNAAKWIHEIGINIVDMAPLALDAVVPYLGTSIYYASSAGKTLESELNQGYSFGEAFVYTIGSTAIEFATEKISGSKFFGGGVFKKWERFGGFNLGTKIVHDVLGEGLEEVVSEIGSDLWHGTVTGDFQLFGQNWKDSTLQLFKTFAIGGLIGGIMVGGNAALQSSIISKSAVTFKNSAGKSINLSVAKAAVIQDFIQKTGKKIEEGKTVSERTKRKFDILKDFKIQNTDIFEQLVKKIDKAQRTGKDITDSDLAKMKPSTVSAVTEEGYYDAAVGPRIKRKLKLLELVRGIKKGTVSKDTAKKSFAEEAAALRAEADGKPGNNDTASEFVESTGLDKESLALIINEALDADSRDKNQKDFIGTGAITLGKMYSMFGEDAVTQGVNMLAQYQNKTINEIVELAQIGTEDSAFNEVKTDTSVLSEHFMNAEFIVVEAKANTDIGEKYTEISKVAKNLKKSLKNFESADIKLFFTTGSTVSTSFFIDNTLYINAGWLTEADIGRINDTVISKYLAEDARRIMDVADKYKAARTLLYETMAKIDNPNRSSTIMLQELAYIMIYQKHNNLLKQILSFAPDKSGMDAVIDYFDKLRRTYASVSVQKAVGQGLSNIIVTAEEVFDTGEDPKHDITLPTDKTESVKDIVDAYQNMKFRAFPFITGKNGIPTNAAKVQAMYLHMKNTYGFNKKLDLTKKINWIKQLTDAKNYDGDGYTRLVTELNKFRGVKTSTGYTRSTVPTNKTLSELLNYYLDVTCGLMVFSNGVITESEMTTQVFNIEALSQKAEELAQMTEAPRDSIGTVADYISLTTRGRLLPVFQNMPIYATYDSNSSSEASIIGDTNTGMAIVINLANVAELQKTTMHIGGTRLVLNSDGELVRNTDGSFVVRDYSKTVSKLAYTIGHEIGHSIGMMLGFNGTFSETDIAKTYVRLFNKMNTDSRRKVIDSITTWLTKDTKVKPEMRSLAAYLGVSKADIEADSNKVESAILSYINDLNSAVTSDLNNEQLIKLFGSLAEYLYFTGFAHEMFANGESESVAREDIIRSKLSNMNNINATVLITESDLEFIKILNGQPLIPDPEFFDNYLFDIQNSPETVTRRILANIKSVQELATELNVSFASELTSPDFWRSKVKKSVASGTRSNLISALEEKYDCTYDSIKQEFSDGYVSHALRDNYASDSKAKNFSKVILNDGKVIDAKNHYAYNNSNIQVFFKYNKTHLILHILPGTQIYEDSEGAMVINGKRLVNVPKRTTYLVDGKMFNTLNALRKYINSEAVTSKNSDFESVFERVIEQADTIGRQFSYKADTIYITSDGKIYNLDIDMVDWNGYAEMVFKGDASKAQALLGYFDNFSTENPEGISDKLISLLDEKQVVRLYKQGNSWSAYGTPNKLQNDFINELKAEKQNITSYIEDIRQELTKRLFINLAGDKPKVEIHNDAPNDFHEIDWKKSEWYNTICQIISKYDIDEIQDLELLGFSQDFINQIKSGKEPDFYAYLRDDTQTDFSRNILIENRSKHTFKSGDWKNNPNIRSINDARNYWKIACVLKDIMPTIKNKDGSETPVIFNNILELRLAMEKAKNDPINIPIIERTALLNEKIESILGSELYIQILNYDAKYGAALDKASLNGVFERMSFYANSVSKRKNTGAGKDVALEIEDEEGEHTMIRPGAESDIVPQEEIEEYDSDTEKAITERFEQEIRDAKELSSPELQNEELRKILDRLSSPLLKNYSKRDLIRNSILTVLSGGEATTMQEKELNALKERVESYKKMEPNSPEQLQERRSLIRLYEKAKNTKIDNLSKGGQTYHKRYLELLSGVGTYNVNMSAAFSRLFKSIRSKRDMSSNPEIFDKQVAILEETFNNFKKVDMEYPGWYQNYEKLLEVLKVWNDPSEQNIIDGKPLKSVLFDINTFLNEFLNPEDYSPSVQQKVAEFRQRIAKREGELDYIFTKNVRGAKMVKSDLERFNDIPDNLKDISKFPPEAQDLYNKFAARPEILSKFLQTPNKVESALRLYGEDFIYNLKRLYNDLTIPVFGTGVSESKKDLLEDMMSDLFSEEEIAETTSKVKTYKEAKATGDKIKYLSLLSYSKFAIDRAKSLREYLAAGNPISDVDRRNALREATDKIKSYRWNKNEWHKVFVISQAPVLNLLDTPDSSQYTVAKAEEYARSQREYNEAYSNYINAQALIENLEKDDWIVYLPRYLKDKELQAAVHKYNAAIEVQTSNVEANEKIKATYLQTLKELNEKLDETERSLIQYTKDLDNLGPDPRQSKIEYTLNEIAKLEKFFEQEYAKREESSDLRYKLVHDANPGKWAVLRTLRENLKKLSVEDPTRYNIKKDIRNAQDTIKNIESQIIAVSNELNELPDINATTLAYPAGAEAARNKLLDENRKNLPDLKTIFDKAKLAYDTVKPIYESVAKQYYNEKTQYSVKFDENAGVYKSVKTANTKLESDRLRYKLLQESRVSNILKLLKNEKIEILRNGDNVSIAVSASAPARVERINKILKQYFGTEVFGFDKQLPVKKELKSLTRGQKYRIITALNVAYYNFMDDPQTDRSRDRFDSDITTALQTGQVNATIPGDTKKRLLSIQVPEKYNIPLEAGGEALTENDINEKLKHIFNADLSEPSTKDIDALNLFDENTDIKTRAVDAFVEGHKTEADILREFRLRRDKHIARRRNTVLISGDEAKMDVWFSPVDNAIYGKNSLGNLVRYDTIERIATVRKGVYDEYMSYNINKGIKEGWLEVNGYGNVVDTQNPDKVIYYNYEDLENDVFDDSPSEDDFTGSSGISNLVLDDFDIFDENTIETPVKEKEYKGAWSETKPVVSGEQLKTGLSENTAKMLDYIPYKWEEDGAFSSATFLEDNAAYVTKFTNSERDMKAFISKIESNPSVPINSPQEAIIFVLLNKVYNRTTLTENADLHNRADILIKQLTARAGRTLGMTKQYGVTPVEQLATLCSKLLNLSEDEKQLLADVTTVQENAIATYNYARANEAMEAVLDIFRKHKDELPTSTNVFAKGLTPEERTARWTNIANNVSSWKYFAMLGTPTTFFTKNIASNVIITGMDAAAEGIAKLFQSGKTLSADYSFTDAVISKYLADGKDLKLLSIKDVSDVVAQTVTDQTDAKQIDIAKLTKDLNAFITTRHKVDGKMPSASRVASRANEWMRKRFYQYKLNKSADANTKAVVKANLVDNGLLSGIMQDQVAKYDRGYDTKIGKLRNIVLNEETKLDDLSESEASVLSAAVKKDAPFGNNPNNVLNKYYRFIFRTMELGDKKFIEPKIIKTVEKLVASNMTTAEIAALQNGDKEARAKFNEFVQYAVDDAMKTYFRSNSEFQKKIMRLFNGHPIAQMIFGTIMPFPRMALNTMSTALSYSPAGFIKAVYIASTSQDAFTRLKVSKELGKATVGSVLIAIGASLAAAGILDFDDDDEYAGVQLVIANKIKVSLNDLAPSALPMVIGATMTHGWTEGFWNGVYAGGNALLDATLLGEAIEIFGGNKKAGDVITDTFSSFVNQFVPSAFRHIARTIDPTQKKYSSNKGAKIIQRIAAAIPGVSLLVPSKVDPYTGNAVYQNADASRGWAHVLSFANAFSPAKISLNMESDIEEESKAVGAATTGPAKIYKINGIEYVIPDELYRDYQILRAKLYSQYAQSVINTPNYQNMSIEKKRLKLKALQNKATEEARKQLNIGK